VPCVRQRLTQILEGKVASVIRGLRRQALERGLSAAKKKALSRICRYFSKNRSRMATTSICGAVIRLPVA